MKNRDLLVSVLAAALPATGVAAGETVPCPDQKAGQWHRYAKTDVQYNSKTELLVKIDSVEGDRLVQNGGTLVTDRMGNWLRIGQRLATPKWYARIECPFSLGEARVYKDVAYDLPDAGSKARGTFTVTVDPAFIPMTVKAGTFNVVRIVSDNSAVGTGGPGGVWPWRVRIVSYYAPEIGAAVKTEFSASLPTQREVTELLEYSLGD